MKPAHIWTPKPGHRGYLDIPASFRRPSINAASGSSGPAQQLRFVEAGTKQGRV